MAAAVREVFWLSTPDLSRLIFVSQAFERVWGRSCESALKVADILVDTIHPEDRARVLLELQGSQKTRGELNYRILQPDGSIRWIRNSVMRILDERGQVVMLAGSAADTTEHKYFQKALIDSHARFVTVLDSIDADIHVSDLTTHEILFANKHVRESIGRDLIGKRCWEVFHLAEGPCAHCTSASLVDGDSKPTGASVWEEKSPVTGRWYLNFARAIRWVDGRLVRIQIATDLTRFKELEAEGRRIQGQLQQAQKMEAIGTLAGGIAHDFNNILSAVMGYTEIAMLELGEEAPVYRRLDEVLKAAARARDLIRQILTFSRQTDQQFQSVRLGLLVKEAMTLMRASLPSTIGIQLQLDSQSAICAEPTQIHQVILNLCANAAHAMREKGGTLTLGLEDVDPDEGFYAEHPGLQKGRYLKLSVADTGHGMDPPLLARVFEPFFTTKERGEGTGMGLSVVLGIVKAHRGAITVDSRVGEGTHFAIYLPAAEGDELQDLCRVIADLPTGSERILLVDDETTLVDLSRQMLERLGYQVTAFSSSTEALAWFEANPNGSDLVITDMTMPRMSGDELARRILAVRPDIPVILCTGYSESISKEKAQALGIREFVYKPMVISELAHTLRKALEARADPSKR
jgi:PAS domain S-box-containing protein